MGDITKVLKHEQVTITQCRLTQAQLADTTAMIDEVATVSTANIAEDLVIELVTLGGDPRHIVQERCAFKVLMCS